MKMKLISTSFLLLTFIQLLSGFISQTTLRTQPRLVKCPCFLHRPHGSNSIRSEVLFRFPRQMLNSGLSDLDVASPIELKGPMPDNDSLCSEYAFIRSLDCDIIKQDWSRYTLLTAQEECSLSRLHRVARTILEQQAELSRSLNRNVSTSELAAMFSISPAHLQYLLLKGTAAVNKLMVCNVRLLLRICARYKSIKTISYGDLVQAGSLGLRKAVDKFNPDLGYRFATYASNWIRQAAADYVAKSSRFVRVPRRIHDLLQSIYRVKAEFESLHGAAPTHADIAELLGIPTKRVEHALKCEVTIISSDTKVFGEHSSKGDGAGDRTLNDQLESEGGEFSAINEFEETAIHQCLAKCLQTVGDRERAVLQRRLGLGFLETPKSLADISAEFGITRERVRQIEIRAIQKLRTGPLAEELDRALGSRVSKDATQAEWKKQLKAALTASISNLRD